MKLTEINVYPIKSLKGLSISRAKIEAKGLEYDRRWMLVDEKNNFITQREIPKLATLNVELQNQNLIVTSDDHTISVPIQPNSEEFSTVKIWSGRCRAEIYEENVNEWFSNVLETKCKLVLMPEATQRKVNPFYAVRKFEDVVSFADGYPYLIIGKSSLEDLNSRMEKAVPMNRFRPNFVFDDSEAFAEDKWKKIKIGSTVFNVVKACDRCVMTTIDQETGNLDGKEPLKTLATYRLKKSQASNKILFGQYLIPENPGENVEVGDWVEVIETKN